VDSADINGRPYEDLLDAINVYMKLIQSNAIPENEVSETGDNLLKPERTNLSRP